MIDKQRFKLFTVLRTRRRNCRCITYAHQDEARILIESASDPNQHCGPSPFTALPRLVRATCTRKHLPQSAALACGRVTGRCTCGSHFSFMSKKQYSKPVAAGALPPPFPGRGGLGTPAVMIWPPRQSKTDPIQRALGTSCTTSKRSTCTSFRRVSHWRLAESCHCERARMIFR